MTGPTPIHFHENKIYLQIAEQLRRLISDGALVVGGALPSEAEMMRTYGTARGTVRQARAVLEKEGLIRARRGKRHIVVKRP